MSITIKVSEKTEQKIRKRAAKIGREVDEVVGALVEEVWDDHFPQTGSNTETEEFKNPFEPFLGKFASGKTDTSSRYKDILLEDIKMPGGFGGE